MMTEYRSKRDVRGEYEKLGEVEIIQGRTAVISIFPGGGFTIAQRVQLDALHKRLGALEEPKSIFLRGALHFGNIERLQNFLECTQDAIDEYYARQKAAEFAANNDTI